MASKGIDWALRLSYAGSTAQLVDLINDWASRVLKFKSDMTSNSTNPWTGHDLIASIYVRDVISRGLAFNSMEAPPTLLAIDALFESFTQLTPEGLRLWDDSVPLESDFWRRIPKYGPLSIEAEMIKKNLGGLGAN